MNKSPRRAQTTQKMSDPAALWQRLALGTCVRYTLILVGVLLLHALFTALDLTGNPYIATSLLWLLLPFSMLLTAATAIRKTDKLSVGLRILLHPLLTYGGFCLFVYLPYHMDRTPSGQATLIILVTAAIVYAAVMAAVLLIARKKTHKTIEKTPYVSHFGDRD